MELTKEEYDDIINKLKHVVDQRPCINKVCVNHNTSSMYYEPFETYNGHEIRRKCPKCGYTELYDPEISTKIILPAMYQIDF